MFIPYLKHQPQIHDTAFIADSAEVMGNVTIGRDVSVWFQCVVRGDVHHITIGEESNVQDGTVIHCTREKFFTEIGPRVTVGHRVTLHGCIVEEGALVGINATVLDGARIGASSIIAAGTLIPPGKVIPPKSMVMGVPGKVVRELTEEELASLDVSWQNYVKYKNEYLALEQERSRHHGMPL